MTMLCMAFSRLRPPNNLGARMDHARNAGKIRERPTPRCHHPRGSRSDPTAGDPVRRVDAVARSSHSTSRGEYWVARFRGLRPLAGNDTVWERATALSWSQWVWLAFVRSSHRLYNCASTSDIPAVDSENVRTSSPRVPVTVSLGCQRDALVPIESKKAETFW